MRRATQHSLKMEFANGTTSNEKKRKEKKTISKEIKYGIRKDLC